MKKISMLCIILFSFSFHLIGGELDSLLSQLSIYEDSIQLSIDSQLVNNFPHEAEEPLKSYLKGDDWAKRYIALRVLSKYKNRAELLKVLISENVKDEYLLYILKGFETDNGHIAELFESKEPKVRLAYIKYLASLKNSNAVEKIIEMMKVEKNEFMFSSLINAVILCLKENKTLMNSEKAVEVIKCNSFNSAKIGFSLNRLSNTIDAEKLKKEGDNYQTAELIAMSSDSSAFKELLEFKSRAGIYYLRGLAYLNNEELKKWIYKQEPTDFEGKITEIKQYYME